LAADLRAVPVSCLDKPEGNDFGAVRRLAALLREFGAEAVHSHDWGGYLETAAAAWLAGVPVAVHTVHGRYMAYPPGRGTALKKSLRHVLERIAARRFGNVVCVSDALRTHVAEEIGIREADTRTIANGIAVAEPPLRAAPNAPGVARLTTVGRLAAVKNVPLLLRAFAPLAARWPGVSLRIVGDGPERAALEALAASLGISGSVEFTGVRSDIDRLLQDADVFVLASLSEGVPMSILEAMRAGLPVVATRVGGVPTTVADGVTGLLVESGDEAGLTRALAELIEQPTRSLALGRAGFERVRATFSIDAMVAAYERLYESGGRP